MDAVRPSPARAEPHDATAWLPLPAPESLPPIDGLLAPERDVPVATPSPAPLVDGASAVSSGSPAKPVSPARAEPHDETSWLPLPDLADLPSIDELLTPDPTVAAPAPRELLVAHPSPARAEPHDATAWLPVPDVGPLPLGDELERDGNGRRPHRRRARRVHIPFRSMAVAAVVVTMLGGTYWAFNRVTDAGADVALHVDGRLIRAETGVTTVGSLLAEEKVQLGEHDRVVPAASTPIDNGMTVRVLRAFPVNVDFDGVAMTVPTTYNDPTEFLKDFAHPNVGFRTPPDRITKGASVVIRTKREGTLFVDGQGLAYNSPSYTVQELVETYQASGQIVVGPSDIVTPGLPTVLPPRGSVTITRVATDTVQVDEPYDLPDVQQPDKNMNVGETRVEPGVTGLQRVTYQVTNHNGKEAERTPISKVPINPAKPKIMYFGTQYDPRWDKIAECETGGNWAAAGQKFQGGLGIFYKNWSYYGGKAFAPTAGQATKYEQIIVAERIRKDHGFGAWGCGRRLGYA